MSKFNAASAGVKWGASKVKSIFTGGKQKTTGTEVIKKFPKKFKGSKSIEDIKFKSSIQKFRKSISLDDALKNLGQVEQKISGRPITKSGFSKGKDLPPPKKKKD